MLHAPPWNMGERELGISVTGTSPTTRGKSSIAWTNSSLLRKNAHSGGDHHSCRQFLDCFFFVCSKLLHPPRPRDCDVIKAQQAINQIDHVPVTVQCLRWLGRPTTQWWWRQRQQCGNGGGQRSRWQRCGAIDRQWWQHYYISWHLGVSAVTVAVVG